jgi:pilus assembly protein Flp/PilA
MAASIRAEHKGEGLAWTVIISPPTSYEVLRIMKALFNRFVREEKGQDLIEYALLAGFISLAAVGAVTAVGTELTTLYENVEDQVIDAQS